MATITNPNESLIFAGDAKDISVSCSGPLTVTIEVGGGEFSFKADPVNGTVVLPLRQLLKALPVPSIGLTDDNMEIAGVDITASDTAPVVAPISLKVLPGKIGCEQEDVPGVLVTNFATWRPQVCKVCKWGKDRMYIVVPFSYGAMIPFYFSGAVRIKAYTDVGLLSLNSFMTFENANGTIMSVPCDYATVAAALQQDNPDLDFGEIIAYDINFYWNLTGRVHSSSVQRFVLARSRSDWRQFIFRNSLGVFDALYSTGSFKDAPEYDIVQFTNNETDSEIDNHISRIFEVNTGRISDELERRMWLEFFGSDERYMVSPYDSTPRRIIVDEVECKHTLRQSNTATFRFHFAEPDAGRLVVREELPEWTDYGGRLMTAEGDYFKTSEGKFIILKRE